MNIKEIAVCKYRSSARKYRRNELKSVPCKYVHFSLDDVIGIFEDLTIHKETYRSIFEQPLLGYLKTLHEIYDIKVSLYCFFKDEKGYCLSQTTDQYSHEFQSHADWMKFGFHGYDCHKIYTESFADDVVADYKCVINELIRITGGGDCLTGCIRLSSFQGEAESIRKLMDLPSGVKTLLTADDNRNSYSLSDDEEKQLRSGKILLRDGIEYIHTDIRIEHYTSFENWKRILDTQENVVIFTHEYYIPGFRIRRNLEKLLLEIMKQDYSYTCLTNTEERRETNRNEN